MLHCSHFYILLSKILYVARTALRAVCAVYAVSQETITNLGRNSVKSFNFVKSFKHMTVKFPIKNHVIFPTTFKHVAALSGKLKFKYAVNYKRHNLEVAYLTKYQTWLVT